MARTRPAIMAGMPGNSFGELFRVTTAGVSHGPGYLLIIDGCPPGLPLSADDLLPDLRRGDPGGEKDKYRPGHAAFTFDAKYGRRDHRGGGRSSARETVCRVAAGAVAKKVIAMGFGGRVTGYVKQI